jgi:hypothetical protein
LATHGTYVEGVSNNGSIVGTFLGRHHLTAGFIETGGVYHTIIDPHANRTYAAAVNSAGDVVINVGVHSFLYT